jgi:hypothetical protein
MSAAKGHHVGAIGWLYSVRDGSAARGSVDTDGVVKGSFEEMLGSAMRVGFSTEANLLSHEYKWGMSMAIVF